MLYTEALAPSGIDPWILRNEYIHVMLGERTLPDLILHLGKRRLDGEQMWKIRLLLEAQRERQRIFTSCGWYFDDFSRIEPKNNVAYAAQAVYLARLATGIDLAPKIIALLKRVVSHRTGLHGDIVFQRQLQRAEGLGIADRTSPVAAW